ncbi:hypothetical protein JA1_003674 [Spathaspora sp. JA1]|nr:hypothetical protein JA1_003674 [Spathaspora sp. JA1]
MPVFQNTTTTTKTDDQRDVISELKLAIENYRPFESKIGTDKYDKISKDIRKAFKVSKLKDYVNEMKKKPEFSHIEYRKANGKRVLKQDIVDTILLDIWKLNKVDEQLLTDSLEKRTVPVLAHQQYLLDPERSSLFEELKRIGVDAEFRDNALHMSGTEADLNTSEQKLHEVISKFRHREIDVSYMEQQYNITGRRVLPLTEIQEAVNVYFEHVEGGRYIVHAKNMRSIILARQLLVWALDYNPHVVNEVYNKSGLYHREFIPFNNDESLAWAERSTNSYYQLIKSKGESHNSIFLSKLMKMNDQSMSSNVLTELVDLRMEANLTDALNEYDLGSNAESNMLPDIEHNDQNNQVFGSNEVKDLNDNQEIELERKAESSEQINEQDASVDQKPSQAPQDEEQQIALENITSEHHEAGETTESETLLPNTNGSLSQSQEEFETGELEGKDREDEEPLTVQLSDFFSESTIDEVYRQINDTNYTKELKGVPADAIVSKAITASFGNILLKSQTSDDLFPKLEDVKVNEQSEFKFMTNGIPYINDIVTSLPAIPESPDLPYSTKVHIKFVPSLLNTPDGSTDVSEYIKYPPIEIQANINEFGAAHIDSVLTVEAEKNVAIPLPNTICDIQLSKVIAGDLLNPQVGHEPTDEDTEGLLSESKFSSNFERFKTQPGLVSFLEESNLKFKGSGKVIVRPFIDIYINNEKIRYDLMNMTYRLEIPFAFRDRMVLLAIIEGGEFGGRKTEVIFGEGELTKEEFKSFLTDIAQFLQKAS